MAVGMRRLKSETSGGVDGKIKARSTRNTGRGLRRPLCPLPNMNAPSPLSCIPILAP